MFLRVFRPAHEYKPGFLKTRPFLNVVHAIQVYQGEKTMKKLGYLALLGLFALPAFAATETFTDVPVVDSNCSKKVADNPDSHPRACQPAMPTFTLPMGWCWYPPMTIRTTSVP